MNLSIEPPVDSGYRHLGSTPRQTTHYTYADERGRDLFRVVRIDTPTGKQIHQERPSPGHPGQWLRGLADTRRVLYRLPELLASDPSTPVLIPEGGKCVDALIARGYVATCNPGGTGMGWRPEFSEPLRGRRVVILPDNDKLGGKHAIKVAQALHGIAGSIAVVDLAGLPPKGDSYDWFQASGTTAELDALIATAPAWEPGEDGGQRAGQAVNSKYRDFGSDWGIVRPRPQARAAFPLDVLPSQLRDLASDAADALRCPVDFTAAAILACCSAALAGSYRLHIMNEFSVTGAIWLTLVGPPGCGKGPAYGCFTAPLQEQQREAYRRYKDQVGDYQQKLDDWEALPKKDRTGLERPVPPVWRPVTVDDATLEAIAVVLEAVERGVPLLNEELAGFLRGMGQYKKASNDQEQWLRIYDSRDITVLRKLDGPRHIARPVVPIFGTTQPEVITTQLRNNANGLRERLLFVYPLDAGPQALEERPPLAGLAGYRGLIAALLSLDFEVPADLPEGTSARPRLLRLTPEAKATWTRIEQGFVKTQGVVDFDPALRGAYAKGRGHAARLACLLHVIQHLASNAPALAEGQALADVLEPEALAALVSAIPAEVTEQTVIAAWRLTGYFLDHTGALFHENQRGDARLDRAVAWIEQHQGEAKLRDLARSKVAGDQSAKAAKGLADALVDRGLARMEERTIAGNASTWIVLARVDDVQCAS